jgi:hypothetical protein
MNMTDFVNSNYIKAEDLAENVLIEAVIAEVKRKEFEENGEIVVKAVIALEDGRQVVLNQTRLKALIGTWGHNSANWIGKTVSISRGQAMHKGKLVPTVKIEPIVAPMIGITPQESAHSLPTPRAAAKPDPAQITRGSSDIRSGPSAWDNPPPSAPPPTAYDGPTGPDDDIAF